MGAFAIYNDCDTDSTVISNLFIDEYMKDANDVQIKVYLYLIRMMSAGRSTSISDMAELFNHTEKEIGRSLLYWEKKGLLSLQRDSRNRLVSIHLCELRPQIAGGEPVAEVHSEESHVVSIEPMLEKTAHAKKQAKDPAAATVAQTAPVTADNDKAELLFVVEQYIGKPLSTGEMQTIYFISDELHFSNDLIDYLVQYCVERGKRDFRYIEKVALGWKEQGIQTAQQAQKASVKASSKKRAAGTGVKSGSFNDFKQNTYDFDELEKRLLKN